jgi:hypothetical protein
VDLRIAVELQCVEHSIGLFEVFVEGIAGRSTPVPVMGARPADTIGGSYRRPVASRRRGGA